MPKIKPCLFRNLLFTLGLGLGLLLTAPSNCLGLAVSTTSFYVENHWQLSFPASDSLLNPEKNLQLEPALTGLFLLHGGREWLFKNGGRFVFADTVQLRLDRKEPELGNRLNELYFALNPTDNFFLDLGKQVVGGGVGYFLNPAGLWPEQTALRQDRTLPPEGKVLIRGEYLFPHLTLEVGWAPPLEWAEDEDGFIQRYFGSAQKTALAWVLTSGGLAGVDLSLLLSPGKQWKTGLSLAKVWGDQLETHAEIGWAERNDRQVEQVNKLFCALIQEATGVCPPPIKATTEKSHLKVLVGGITLLPAGRI